MGPRGHILGKESIKLFPDIKNKTIGETKFQPGSLSMGSLFYSLLVIPFSYILIPDKYIRPLLEP